MNAYRMHARMAGASLIELMVALLIGLFIMAGALSVHFQSRATHHIAENVARLQENGRFALDFLGADVRMAGFWMDTEYGTSIDGRTGTATAVNGGVGPANDCYAGSFINVGVRIEGYNDDGATANPWTNCVADANRVPGTDILIVRRVATDPTPFASLEAGRLYLVSKPIYGRLFLGGQPLPSGYTLADPIHAVMVNVYYVSPSSSLAKDIPSLRRLELDAGPTLVDRELIAGVEDLQFQLGIDPDTDGSVNQYLSPGPAALAAGRVASVRMWLSMRTERTENGFTDNATYEFADVNVVHNDGFRRQLVSSTVQLRNGS